MMTEKQKILIKKMKELVKATTLDDDNGLGICLSLRKDEQIDKMLAYLEEHPNAEQDDIMDYAEELERK